MHITITEKEYQELMRFKRGYEAMLQFFQFMTNEDYYYSNQIDSIPKAIDAIKTRFTTEKKLMKLPCKDFKWEHEVLRDKISTRIGQLREGRKDSRLSESEKLTMAIFIDMLQELLT